MVVDSSPREAIGQVCHIVPDEELGLYAVDGLTPRVVAYPKSAEEVAVIVRLAAEHGWAVAPRGGGTQMALGDVPRAVDVMVCTTDMDQVLEYEPADLVATVQAGIRLAELQRRLGEHGQLLALDPPLAEQATIGGIIAANPSGPLRLRYGTCRDLLIGVKVVNPDGNITKGGGKVVKNVTGYDMCKLYTGSLGTLGIVVEASFKLMPLPRAESTILARFGRLEDAYAAARAIYKSALPIRACELLSPAAAEQVLATAGGEPAGDGELLLAIWIGGGEAAVARQNRDVLGLCAAASRTRLLDGGELGGFWRGVEDAGRERSATIAKISTVPSHTGELLARLPEGASYVSHVLSGVTYVFDVSAQLLAPLLGEMKGYVVLEACPLEVKRTRSVWGPTGEDFGLMERIKREFDPDGILNPGRYVGGL